MAPTGRGGLRPNQQSKIQPLIIICLLVSVMVLGVNYWSLMKKNSVLLEEIGKVQESLKRFELERKDCRVQLLAVEEKRKQHESADKEKEILLEDTRRVVEDQKVEADVLRQNITKLLSQMASSKLSGILKENKSRTDCDQRLEELRIQLGDSCTAEKEKVEQEMKEQLNLMKEQLKLQYQETQHLDQMLQQKEQQPVQQDNRATDLQNKVQQKQGQQLQQQQRQQLQQQQRQQQEQLEVLNKQRSKALKFMRQKLPGDATERLIESQVQQRSVTDQVRNSNRLPESQKRSVDAGGRQPPVDEQGQQGSSKNDESNRPRQADHGNEHLNEPEASSVFKERQEVNLLEDVAAPSSAERLQHGQRELPHGHQQEQRLVRRRPESRDKAVWRQRAGQNAYVRPQQTPNQDHEAGQHQEQNENVAHEGHVDHLKAVDPPKPLDRGSA